MLTFKKTYLAVVTNSRIRDLSEALSRARANSFQLDKLDLIGSVSLGNGKVMIVLSNKYRHQVSEFSHRPLNLTSER